jgi:2-hydroxycyclohexanecarboxyl-CoA dehydrogenase
VVNNAQGIAPLLPVEDKPDSDYAMTLATGFYHSLWTSKAAFPFMKAQGHGRVINFSSHWNLHGMRFSSDYNFTKSANESLTRSLANEWGKYGITVNCITPAGDSAGYKMYKDFNPAVCAVVERTIPARRMGDCERDIAGAVLGLVSENGRFITGQTFCVDGGAWLVAPMTDHEIGTEIHHGREQAAATVA